MSNPTTTTGSDLDRDSQPTRSGPALVVSHARVAYPDGPDVRVVLERPADPAPAPPATD